MSCWYYNRTGPDCHTSLPPPSVPHIPMPLVSGTLAHLDTCAQHGVIPVLCPAAVFPDNPSDLAASPCHTHVAYSVCSSPYLVQVLLSHLSACHVNPLTCTPPLPNLLQVPQGQLPLSLPPFLRMCSFYPLLSLPLKVLLLPRALVPLSHGVPGPAEEPVCSSLCSWKAGWA